MARFQVANFSDPAGMAVTLAPPFYSKPWHICPVLTLTRLNLGLQLQRTPSS